MANIAAMRAKPSPDPSQFESLDGFKMYYTIGMSVSSLHRESTDSLILLLSCTM